MDALALNSVSRPRRANPPRSPSLRHLGALLAVILIFALWTLLASLLPSYLFPSFPATVAEIWALAQRNLLLPATLATVRSVVLGSLGALVLGTAFGFVLHRFESFGKPFLYLFQTVPSVIWALMAIIWFGLSPASVIFVVVIVGMPLVAINVWEGFRNVDQLLLEMGKSVEATPYMVWRYITLPSLQPYLMSAARNIVSQGWRYAILGELFAGGAGIGHQMFFAWERQATPQVFAWALWLVLLMLLTEYTILQPINRRVTRWRAR